MSQCTRVPGDPCLEHDVVDNLDGVLESLLAELEKQPLTPLSPQAGRGSPVSA
jgi:hypothetical protein